MNATKPKRKPLGCGRWFLYAIVAVLAACTIVETTWLMIGRAHVLDALQRADYVELKHYGPYTFQGTSGLNGEPGLIGYKKLGPEDFHQVADAFPLRPDCGAFFAMKMCFVPHHHVIIHEKDGTEYRVSVCFTCDMIGFKGSPPYPWDMPYLWMGPVKKLFDDNGTLRNKTTGGRGGDLYAE